MGIVDAKALNHQGVELFYGEPYLAFKACHI